MMEVDQAGATDEPIVATLDALWSAAGVAPGDLWLGEWTGRVADTGRCAELPEDERWHAHRLSRLPGDLVEPRPLFDALAAWLEAAGYAVRRYRAPLSGRLELRAHGAALTVLAAVSTNGATTVQVFAGPCAPFVADEPPPGLTPLG